MLMLVSYPVQVTGRHQGTNGDRNPNLNLNAIAGFSGFLHNICVLYFLGGLVHATLTLNSVHGCTARFFAT